MFQQISLMSLQETFHWIFYFQNVLIWYLSFFFDTELSLLLVCLEVIRKKPLFRFTVLSTEKYEEQTDSKAIIWFIFILFFENFSVNFLLSKLIIPMCMFKNPYQLPIETSFRCYGINFHHINTLQTCLFVFMKYYHHLHSISNNGAALAIKRFMVFGYDSKFFSKSYIL